MAVGSKFNDENVECTLADLARVQKELTSPSALFSSSSFCLAWSSAIRCSIALSDSRVNGRNRLFSSLENEESVSAMDMVECTSYTLVGLPPPDCWRGLKHVNPLKHTFINLSNYQIIIVLHALYFIDTSNVVFF